MVVCYHHPLGLAPVQHVLDMGCNQRGLELGQPLPDLGHGCNVDLLLAAQRITGTKVFAHPDRIINCVDHLGDGLVRQLILQRDAVELALHCVRRGQLNDLPRLGR